MVGTGQAESGYGGSAPCDGPSLSLTRAAPRMEDTMRAEESECAGLRQSQAWPERREQHSANHRQGSQHIVQAH